MVWHSSIMLLLVSLITYALPYHYYYRTASCNSSKYFKRIVHADIHSSDLEGKCISDGSKLEERNQEILPQNFLPATEIWLQKREHWQMLIALERNNKNLFNWLTLLDIMTNSTSCIQNKHDSCDGTVKSLIDGSDNTKICTCQCHSSSYQLTKKMFGIINQKE